MTSSLAQYLSLKREDDLDRAIIKYSETREEWEEARERGPWKNPYVVAARCGIQYMLGLLREAGHEEAHLELALAELTLGEEEDDGCCDQETEAE